MSGHRSFRVVVRPVLQVAVVDTDGGIYVGTLENRGGRGEAELLGGNWPVPLSLNSAVKLLKCKSHNQLPGHDLSVI